MVEGRSTESPKESVQVLPTRGIPLEALEEKDRDTTTSGHKGRGPNNIGVRVPRESLGGSYRNVGNIRDVKGEVLVTENVQGCRPFRGDV